MGKPEDDIAILVPEPRIFRVSDKEIRLAPLPIKRLVGVVKFVESNKDVLDKANTVLETGVSVFLEGEVYRRFNALLRLVVSPQDKHEFLTDEWCADHLTNGHYRAMFMTVLRQNELESVFQKAKAFLGLHMEGALRQAEKAMAADRSDS